MKKLIACTLAGLIATSALAGDKSVIYYTMVDVTGPVNEVLTPVAGTSPFVKHSTSAAVSGTQAQSNVRQSAYQQQTEDTVYANLLKEAEKRGLR